MARWVVDIVSRMMIIIDARFSFGCHTKHAFWMSLSKQPLLLWLWCSTWIARMEQRIYKWTNCTANNTLSSKVINSKIFFFSRNMSYGGKNLTILKHDIICDEWDSCWQQSKERLHYSLSQCNNALVKSHITDMVPIKATMMFWHTLII
jgi:hypothetical protein